MKIQSISIMSYKTKNYYTNQIANFNAPKEVTMDYVDFTGRNNEKRYEKQVEKAYLNQEKNNTQLHTDDIKYLLNADYNEFKKIISKPVRIDTYNDKHKVVRRDTSNVFFHTDAKATEALIKKLDDPSALMEILSTVKSGSFGYTVMHYAAMDDELDKIKAIKNGLSLNDFELLINQKDDIDDDTPYELAISSGKNVRNYLEKYALKY